MASDDVQRVKRVGVGMGYAVHAFCLEFSNGERSGVVLSDSEEKMDITDDENLRKRKVKWQELQDDEFIQAVSGFGCRKGYLAASLTLSTNTNRELLFHTKRANWIDKQRVISFEALGKEICELQFGDGTCVGIKSYCRTTGQYKVQADAAPPVTMPSQVPEAAASAATPKKRPMSARAAHDRCGAKAAAKKRALSAGEAEERCRPKALSASGSAESLPPVVRQKSSSPRLQLQEAVVAKEEEAESGCEGMTGDYDDALSNLAKWKSSMQGPAKILDAAFYREHKATKKWQCNCCICGPIMNRGAADHIPGKAHYGVLYNKLKEQTWPTLDEARGFEADKWWVQAWEMSVGRYVFNHLTGESRWDRSGGLGHEEPIRPSAGSSSSTSGKAATAATPRGSWGRRAESVPLYRFAFVESEKATPHGHCTVQRQRSAQKEDWILPEASKTPDGHEYRWFRDRDGPFWYFALPAGSYVIHMGFHPREIKYHRRLVPYKFEVNGEREAAKLAHWHSSEVMVQRTVLSAEDGLWISGIEALVHLKYVHVWGENVSVPMLPMVSLPTEVPEFSSTARGLPRDWNAADTAPRDSPQAAMFWSRKVKDFFGVGDADLQPDINVFLKFLCDRFDKDGRSVLPRLGPPIRQPGEWFSMEWLGPDGRGIDAQEWTTWERAWHGCKLEALYSILYHGKLLPSTSKGRGERFLENAQGVYVHKDGTAHKAEHYMRFVPLCDDGVFWAAKWEVRVDRSVKVKVQRQTDQWVQREEGVKLAALWICGRTANQMRDGDSVSKSWHPDLEANPSAVAAIVRDNVLYDSDGESANELDDTSSLQGVRDAASGSDDKGTRFAVELTERPYWRDDDPTQDDWKWEDKAASSRNKRSYEDSTWEPRSFSYQKCPWRAERNHKQTADNSRSSYEPAPSKSRDWRRSYR
eukprot:TRINITY_DN26484_c0_g1_i1.p1 TRINITY_DN26484_c0_g1~~TRINITY_DN26484_c0_g1_i1.p1  ORF type:complete len:925 (+),score=154.82 TRINITY_DN26484_c0_g1_i1:69-2843(+)